MSLQETLNSAVVAAIVGALTGAIASGIVASIVAKKTTLKQIEIENREREERLLTDAYRALLLGREIVLWIKEKQLGNDTEFKRKAEGVREFLNYFKLTDVSPPPDPTHDKGAAATDFVNSLVGRFQISNPRAAAALLLAWNVMLTHGGVVSGDDSVITDLADKAGLPPRDHDELLVIYLERLMEQAEQSLTD